MLVNEFTRQIQQSIDCCLIILFRLFLPFFFVNNFFPFLSSSMDHKMPAWSGDSQLPRWAISNGMCKGRKMNKKQIEAHERERSCKKKAPEMPTPITTQGQLFHHDQQQQMVGSAKLVGEKAEVIRD
jgi:hypothetical protein